MRANIAVVSLLAAGLLVSAAPAPAQPVAPATPRALPQEVTNGVIVDLAEGDRFKVTVARDLRTVWGSRYHADTGAWGARTVVLRKRGIFCGDVDARASATAVAVIAECDKGGYAEDQAPTHSQAIYSPDTVTWHSTTLPGEAYDEPGISPSGNAAIWPMHQQWVTWTGGGFQVVKHALPGQEYSVTGTISDAGDTSVLYGAAATSREECFMHVLTVPVTGPEVRQELAVDNACQDYRLANVDALTVEFGESGYPPLVTTISRPSTDAPWAVTGIPPAEAPGLVTYDGRGTAPTRFASSPGLPLQALGSPDRHTFWAQTYDPVAQRWSPQRQVRSSTTACTWDQHAIRDQLGVLAPALTCGKRHELLVSTDAMVWHDVALGQRRLGVSSDLQYVAASNKRRTLIFSRELGVVRLPFGTRARCDVVQPVSADSAIRLSTNNKRTGWPTGLQESTATGWRHTNTKIPPLDVGSDRCIRVEPDVYEREVSYSFAGHTRFVSLSVTPSGDGWRVERGY